MKKRTMALLAAVLLIVGGIIGGTLAWLTAKTTPVVNTFTTSDINIELTETTGNEYKMIPGWTIEKDPKVTVSAGSEACFLFVKLEKSENYKDYLKDYTIADGWTMLEDGVYYREVEVDDTNNQEFAVLEGNKITVSEDVTKKMMENANSQKPTLTITAYATQLYKDNTTKFSAKDAWDKVKP